LDDSLDSGGEAAKLDVALSLLARNGLRGPFTTVSVDLGLLSCPFLYR